MGQRQECVYKYAGRVGIHHFLQERTLRFTSAAHLNDPLEGQWELGRLVHLSHSANTGKLSEVTERIPTEYRAQFQADWLNALAVLGPREMWVTVSEKASAYGILSLSTKNDDVLMWSHYSEGGHGLCIGFNPNAKVFTDSDHGGLQGLLSVRYRRKKRSFGTRPLEDVFASAMLQKGLRWQYEQELRCFREVADGTQGTLIKFEPDDVEHIVLGPKMSRDLLQEACNLWAEIFPHARLSMAFPDPNRYRMKIAALVPRTIELLLLTEELRPNIGAKSPW